MTDPVLVDTSGLYALLDRADPHHAAAADAWRRLEREDARLAVHSYVLVESAALVQRRLGLAALRALHDELVPLFDITWVDHDLHASAVTAQLASRRRDISLVDRVSFELARRLGARRALAFDRHFAQEGLRRV